MGGKTAPHAPGASSPAPPMLCLCVYQLFLVF